MKMLGRVRVKRGLRKSSCEKVNKWEYAVAWGFFGFGSHAPILKVPRPYIRLFRRVRLVFMYIMTSPSPPRSMIAGPPPLGRRRWTAPGLPCCRCACPGAPRGPVFCSGLNRRPPSIPLLRSSLPCLLSPVIAYIIYLLL